MSVINISEFNFGGRIRCGDILGACNMLEDIRIRDNDSNIKIYLPDSSVFDAEYVYQYRDFLKKYTDYFSEVPGDFSLNLNRFNMWDYRSNIKDRTKVDNTGFERKNKICIFPLFDAPYNTYRNWPVTLLHNLVKFYQQNFSDHEIIICSSRNNQQLLEHSNFDGVIISYNYLDNLYHLMDCSVFIGGNTGISHLAGSLINPPQNIYYYSCRDLLQTFPLNWKTVGEIRSYSEYGYSIYA